MICFQNHAWNSAVHRGSYFAKNARKRKYSDLPFALWGLIYILGSCVNFFWGIKQITNTLIIITSYWYVYICTKVCNLSMAIYSGISYGYWFLEKLWMECVATVAPHWTRIIWAGEAVITSAYVTVWAGTSLTIDWQEYHPCLISTLKHRLEIPVPTQHT